MTEWEQHFNKIRSYYHNKDLNCISEIAIGIELLLSDYSELLPSDYSDNPESKFLNLIDLCLNEFPQKGDIHYIRKSYNKYKHNDGIKELESELEKNIFFHKYVEPTNQMIRYLEDNGYDIKYFINLEFYDETIKNEIGNTLEYNSGYLAWNRTFSIDRIRNDEYVSNPIIAVIHNILSIGPSVSKSNYLSKIKVNNEELETIYQFEILLLNIISNENLNGPLIFKSSSNYIPYINYALEDINYYINLFSNLTNTKLIFYKVFEDETHENDKFVNYKCRNYVINVINEYNPSHHNYFMFSKKQINYFIDEKNICYLEELTKLVFGHSSLRVGQQKALMDILNNSPYDKKYVSLSIMPTGYGKSLVYQLISILHPIKSIVISPTKILIGDQISNAYDNNIYAFGKFEAFKLYNTSKLLYYATPDEIQDGNMYEKFIEYDFASKIGFLFFDEVHQLSIWGHRFDPNFLSLTNYIVRTLRNVVIACFTATATKKTIIDLKDKIQWHNINVLEPCSMVRKNLKHTIVELDDLNDIILLLMKQLREDLKTDGLIMIINNDYSILNKIYSNIQNDYYLSSLTQLFEKYDKYEYELFRSGITRVILASDDFTIGINVKNLKKIYTIGLPCSKEWYYQETGRVCRTDKNCESVVYLLKKLSKADEDLLNLSIKNIELNSIRSSNSLMISNNSYLFDEIEKMNNVVQVMKKLIDELKVFERYERVQYDSSYRNAKICIDNQRYDIYNCAIYFLQLIGFVSYWNDETTNGKRYFSIFFRNYLTYQFFIKKNSIIFNMEYIKEIQTSMYKRDSKALANFFINWFIQNIYLAKRLLLKNVYDTCKKAINDECFLNQIEDDLYSYFMADFIVDASQMNDIVANSSANIENDFNNEVTLESVENDLININKSMSVVMFKNKYQRKYEATMHRNSLIAILLAELYIDDSKFYFNSEYVKELKEEQILFVFKMIMKYNRLFSMSKTIEFLCLLDLNEELLNNIYELNIKEINNILLLRVLNTMEA